MTDIVIEILCAIFIGMAFLTLVLGQSSQDIRNVEGWRMILSGFALIFFGALVDITDNFSELNHFVIIGNTPMQAILAKLVGYLLGFILMSCGICQWLPKIIDHQKMITAKLEETKTKVITLQGLLPICASCKSIRDDEGYWNHIETYISEHSEAEFSHGLCEDCEVKMYGAEDWYKKKDTGSLQTKAQ